MATGGGSDGDGGNTNTNINDDVVNKLTCPICLENYRRPKLLPCFHTFCQKCLQYVAGSSPSFPCPSCRRLILLPPGGVPKLQINFYIEDDSASAFSPLPQRLCDVCADDREATYSCVQCQQRYCLPCRKYHDSFRSCYGHTVVSLSEEDDGCGKGAPLSEKQKVDLCPKHPDQRVLLHCTKCKVSLCLQCKLTQHEGHPTQDLADASAVVKDKLKDRLGTLTQEMTEIDHTITAVQDRCSKLQEQKRTTEAAFRARADTLHQWVKQSLEAVVSSLQSSSEQRAKPWQEGAEQLGGRKQALQAQQDHILRVLKDGQEADLVSLEAQLSSGPEEDDVILTQMKAQLTRDMPTFLVEYNTTAVNPVQLQTFIGMLVPQQQTSGPKGAVTLSLPTSVQGETSTAVSEKEYYDVTATPGLPTSAQEKRQLLFQRIAFVHEKTSAAVSANGSDVPLVPDLPSAQEKTSSSVVNVTPTLPTSTTQATTSAAASANTSDVTGTLTSPTSFHGKTSAAVLADGCDVAATPNMLTYAQGKTSTVASENRSDASDTLTLPTSVQGKTSAGSSENRSSELTDRRGCLPTAGGPVNLAIKKQPSESNLLTSAAVSSNASQLTPRKYPSSANSLLNLLVVKKQPREFNFSDNPQIITFTVTPISQNRLWVMYRSVTGNPLYLKLFDAEGEILTTVQNPRNCLGLVTITGDIILSWIRDSSFVHLVKPDGSLRIYDMGRKIGDLITSGTNDAHYMREINENSLHRVEFMSEDKSASRSVSSPTKPLASLTPLDQLTHSVTDVAVDNIPSRGCPIHASAGGRYFVFTQYDKVEVYARAGSRSSTFVCSYKPKKSPTDARFCQIAGQEMLLVTVYGDNKVHVVDHRDGGHFVRYLDTGTLHLSRPCRLATDHDRHVWIVCEGGKVVVVDL
ncbi:hypothetical protein ACOMHN_006613 [Nucella lapillus]